MIKLLPAKFQWLALAIALTPWGTLSGAPSNIESLPSGLQLHLSADRNDALFVNDQMEVLEWHCQIHDQTSFRPADKAPQYNVRALNGHPAILFGGDSFFETEDYSAVSLTSDLSGLTAFVVGRYQGSGMQSYFRIGEGRSRNALRIMLDRSEHQLRTLARRWDRTDISTLSHGEARVDEWVIDSFTIDFLNQRAALFSNGVKVAEDNNFTPPGRTSPVHSLQFRIGSDHSQQLWQGEIAEILIFNRILTQEEKARVGAFLQKKYAIPYSQDIFFETPELSASEFAFANPTIGSEVLDLTLEPVEINFNPGPEYSDENRDYAMVIGMDRSPGGRLWAAWVAGGDSEKGFFVVSSSDDDGETWSSPRIVIDPPNPSEDIRMRTLVGNFWTDPRGRLWLFYDQSLGYFDGRAGVWAIVSDNPDADQPEWSKPRRIWHGATLSKPLVLDNGEWLLPVSIWTRDWIRPQLREGNVAPFEDVFRELDAMRMAHLLVSTNEGDSWHLRGSVAANQRRFDEHMPVKLKDGRLWMPIRTFYGLAETYSSDNGRTWSEPVPATIQHVPRGARIFLRRLESGRLLLVKHGPIDEAINQRSHLTAFLSDDDGQTWSNGLVLDERTGVSYPDGFQHPDGTIYVIYDRNRSTDSEILMARFTESDILSGGFHSARAGERILVNRALGK